MQGKFDLQFALVLTVSNMYFMLQAASCFGEGVSN